MNSQTPLEDLKRDALKDYSEASTKVGQFNSAIPKAIEYYFDDKIKDKEEAVSCLGLIGEILQFLLICGVSIAFVEFSGSNVAIPFLLGAIIYKITK